MLKLIKWLATLVFILVMIVVIAIVVVPRVVDPNDYKDKISELVKKQTGRDLVLNGNLSVSVFPWLGLKTEQLSLSQPEQIKQSEPMISVDSAQLRVKVAPLLQKRIEIGTIVLEKPRVTIITLANGINSFEGLSGATDEKTDGEEDVKSASGAALALVVQGVHLQDGTLIWDDRQAGSRTKIDNLNIETGDLLSGKYAPLSLTGSLLQSNKGDTAKPELINFKVKGQVKINKETLQVNAKAVTIIASQAANSAEIEFSGIEFIDESSVALTGITVNADLALGTSGTDINKPAKPTKLNGAIAHLNYQLNEQSLSLNGLQLNSHYSKRQFNLSLPSLTANLNSETASAPTLLVASADLDMKLNNFKATQFINKPQASGSLTTSSFDAAQLLADLGLDYQASSNAALRSVALNADFNGSLERLDLNKLAIKIDNSHLNGDIHIVDFDKPKAKFNLVLDQLNLDHYMPKEEDETTVFSSQEPDKKGAQALAVPMALFKDIDANGRFTANQLIASGVVLDNVDVQVRSSLGNVSIIPKASLYDGKLSGKLSYAEKDGQSELHLTNKIDLVSLGELLTDADITKQLSGLGSLALDMVISEKNGVQTNNGTIKLLAKNGKLKGVDVKKILENGQAAYNKFKGREAEKGNADEGDETAFTELLGTFNINNFNISNNDFSLKAPLFRVLGKGDINVVGKTLDYLVSVSVVNSIKGQGGKTIERLKGITLPIRFTGSWLSPKYSIDMKALYKSMAEQKVNEKKDEILKQKLGLENASKLSTKELIRESLLKKASDKYGSKIDKYLGTSAPKSKIPATKVEAERSAEKIEPEPTATKPEPQIQSDENPDVSANPDQHAVEKQAPKETNNSGKSTKEILKEELKNRVLEGLFN